MRAPIAILLLTGLTATAALAQTVLPGPLLPGEEGELKRFVKPAHGARACYARTYTPEHLKKHPKQTVTEMSFRLSFFVHEKTADLPDGQQNYYFELKAKQRGRDKMLDTGGECLPAGDRIECFVECDGGGVRVTRRGDDKILIDFGNYWGIRMTEACGEDPEGEEASVELKPGADDKEFLLTKLPQSECAP